MVNKTGFLNAINQDIEMVRGDTLSFNFEISGAGADIPYIVFSCAEHYEDEPLFTGDTVDAITRESYDEDSDTGLYNIRIAPDLTKDLELSRYYYDMQMEINGDVITLLRGRLTLLYQVS